MLSFLDKPVDFSGDDLKEQVDDVDIKDNDDLQLLDNDDNIDLDDDLGVDSVCSFTYNS